MVSSKSQQTRIDNRPDSNTETGLGEIPEFPAVRKIKVKAGEPTKVEIKKRAWYSVKASGDVEIVPIDVRDAKDWFQSNTSSVQTNP